MNNITLRQLRYFEALARARHFGRAAHSCSVSQPALSVQIRDLENSVGLPLFERGPRQVRLTGTGEAFALRARSVLRAMEEMETWAEAARGGEIERLRIGIIPTIAPYLLPKLISDLSKAHPDMDLHVRETITPNLIQELVEGRLDAAVVALPIDEPDLTEVAVFTEEMVLVRHERDAGSPPVASDALSDMHLLLLEEGHCFRDQTLAFCNINANRPRDGLDGSSLSTLVQMVGAGIGVTLIPDMAIQVESRAAPVCISRFPTPAPTRTVGLVWRDANPMHEALLRIADIVRQSAESAGLKVE
jgi:LysR family transcriptional regulator, hydrogen peroxide-inducible genes activator